MPAQQVAANENLAAVRGVVTNAVTGERLRKAFVRLHPASGNAQPATTDEQGLFSYENLRPGTYKLEAEHVGFLLSLFADDAGVSMELHLAAGETADVKLKLTPQAAISGRLLDPDGDPWVHGEFELYRSVFKQGKRRFEGTGGAEIDDRGDFRIGQLAAGTYYLKASVNGAWERNNSAASKDRLQPTWYPSSPTVEDATPIILTPGQELSGLEIRLRHGATYRVRGAVSGLESLPKNPAQGAQNRRVIATATTLPGGDSYDAAVRPDGTFEIQAIPSGEYNINLFNFVQGSAPFIVGRVRVRVDDRDVEGIVLDVSKTHPLKGSVRYADNEMGQVSGLLLLLTRLDSEGGQFGRTRDDGSFDFPLVSAGRYRVSLPETTSGRFFVKLNRFGGQDSASSVIAVSDAEIPLELILSSRGARVVANVTKADGASPAMAGRVVLIPDLESGEERGFGTRLAVRDQNGVYSIGNIAAGAYRLFAFESVPEEAWVDAEFWKEIRSKGVDLRISEGESRNVDVPLVLKPEISGLLRRLGME
jgi:hypothetical protein